MQRRKLCVALRFDAFYEDKKMRTTHVVVKPYDKKWKMDFEDIKKEIQSAIGDLILGIEHVGSTSVEGLSAKPSVCKPAKFQRIVPAYHISRVS